MGNYKLEINKSELLGILSNYYTKLLGHQVQVKEKHEVEYVGLYENKEAVITLYYEEIVDILGYKATRTTNISSEQLKEILNSLISESGLVITRLDYKSGVRLDGDYREQYETAYFDGITLSLREKGKELVKSRNK